ncbi:Hypothetical predicted protein [Pelobates cultripes]|uniref:Uncharacterized protein n=1 Tax=Pelobates cultripes TaxID=61616 RepID=A0AAD1W7V3_PELCU|nr:Hypothetical predicted protein [Pelobates cultripes]
MYYRGRSYRRSGADAISLSSSPGKSLITGAPPHTQSRNSDPYTRVCIPDRWMPFLCPSGTKIRRRGPWAYRVGFPRQPRIAPWDEDYWDTDPQAAGIPWGTPDSLMGRKSQKPAPAAAALNHDIGQMLASTPRTREPSSPRRETTTEPVADKAPEKGAQAMSENKNFWLALKTSENSRLQIPRKRSWKRQMLTVWLESRDSMEKAVM